MQRCRGQRPRLQSGVAPHGHLRRLARIWIDSPIYFVTTCTHNRRALLAGREIAQILIDEWSAAHDRHGWAIGRYVIRPDHVHFFCRPERESKTLSQFVGAWKSWSSRRVNHVLRPRLQLRCGSASSSIASCDPTKAIAKNGIMSLKIRCGLAWSRGPATGPMREKSKP